MTKIEKLKETISTASKNHSNSEYPIDRNYLTGQLGWKYLGSGAFKQTYQINRHFVFKMTTKWEDAIKVEIRKWKSLNKHLRKWIVGPICWDEEKFRWAIYPYADCNRPYDGQNGSYAWSIAFTAFQLQFKVSNGQMREADIRGHNWGYHLGKMKIVDFQFVPNWKPKGGD